MKILQVNNVYGEKSTGKITKVIHDGLIAAGHEAVSVYGRGHTYAGDGVIRLCPDWYGKLQSALTRITGLRYGGCLLSTARLKAIIRREKPDVVHLQCINGNFVNIYSLIGWLKNQKIKTVVSLHAEFMYTANCGHAFECDQWKQGCRRCPDKKKAVKSLFFDRTGASWRKMKKAFEGFESNCIISPVSPWTEMRARQSDILKNFRFQTVFNGIDAENTFRCDGETERENAIVHVTAHFNMEKDHGKGGWYVAELAKRMPDVTFYVAGPADPCEGLPENLKLLGMIRDQKELAALYRRVKLSLLTSKRETFSMPCAESMCCGTPVVGFEAGAPEQIALKDYSGFAPFGDVDALEKLARSWMQREDIQRTVLAAEAKIAYGARSMVQSLMELYGGMV